MVAFLLPFGTVSCGPLETEVRGTHLISGVEPTDRCQGADCSTAESVSAESDNDLGAAVLAQGSGLATFAFLALGLALLLSLREGRSGGEVSAAIFALAALAVLASRDAFNFADGSVDDGEDAIRIVVELRFGYWIVVALSALAVLLAARTWWAPKRQQLPGLALWVGAAILTIGYLGPDTRVAEQATLGVDRLRLDVFWSGLQPGLLVGVAGAFATGLVKLTPARAGFVAALAAVGFVAAVQGALRFVQVEFVSVGWGAVVLPVGALVVAMSAAAQVRDDGPRTIPVPAVRGLAALGGVALIVSLFLEIANDEGDDVNLWLEWLSIAPVVALVIALAAALPVRALPQRVLAGVLMGTGAAMLAFFLLFIRPSVTAEPAFLTGMSACLALIGAGLWAQKSARER